MKDEFEFALLQEFAKKSDKALSVSRNGSDYYVLKGTSPIDFIELVHIKAVRENHATVIGILFQIVREIS